MFTCELWIKLNGQVVIPKFKKLVILKLLINSLKILKILAHFFLYSAPQFVCKKSTLFEDSVRSQTWFALIFIATNRAVEITYYLQTFQFEKKLFFNKFRIFNYLYILRCLPPWIKLDMISSTLFGFLMRTLAFFNSGIYS